MFQSIARQKPALRKLVAALREKFRYASVLAVEDESKSWSVSRSGISISQGGRMGGTGYVVRVFDGYGCVEYSFNEFGEKLIPGIVAHIEKSAAEQKKNCGSRTDLPTPVPADEPAKLKKATRFALDPQKAGD
ncbi:MAG: hypothetical protein J6V01_02725, partial [Clostridia bacterium]|nr:hypothetical protein [Clostridia bacterium]